MATERQRRNSRWLATHPGTVSAVGAVVFALGGLGYGALVSGEVGWLNAPVGAVLGAVFGGLCGFGFSLGNREMKLKGWKRMVYIGLAVVLMATVFGMRYLRYRN